MLYLIKKQWKPAKREIPEGEISMSMLPVYHLTDSSTRFALALALGGKRAGPTRSILGGNWWEHQVLDFLENHDNQPQ
jgi:hypothetical protein